MRAPVLLVAAVLLAAPLRAASVLYDQAGTKVSLTEREDPRWQARSLHMEVRGSGAAYCWSNGPFGGTLRLGAELRQVSERDGYLFVPASCGGGNASKCHGFQAFRLRPKLVWLGNLTGRWDGKAALPFDGTWFYDSGDQLEINDLLSHAASPRYEVAYLEAKGRLVFDADKTWALNQVYYAAAGNDAPGLLYRAGLAKLCGRRAELKAAERAARQALPAEAWPRFQRSLRQVELGQAQPRPFLPVQACPDKSEKS